MPEDKLDSVITRLMAERDQGYQTRKRFFSDIEEKLKRPLVTYYTSVGFGTAIDDQDVDMLEGLLQSMDLSNGFALMISSLGGDGLAAERIINVCRNYSKTKEFWVIVAGQAKSAATTICFGSSKIIMSPASELGPVDPQVTIVDNKNQTHWVSVFHVVNSYKELFDNAVKQEKGHIEPYIQQLSNYDAKLISHYQSIIELSKDVAIRTLHSGMMKDLSEVQIEEKIKSFLTPEVTKLHGRPIFREEARSSGLNIEYLDMTDDLGKLIYELHVRSRFFTDRQVQKLIENKNDFAYIGISQQ